MNNKTDFLNGGVETTNFDLLIADFKEKKYVFVDIKLKNQVITVCKSIFKKLPHE